MFSLELSLCGSIFVHWHKSCSASQCTRAVLIVTSAAAAGQFCAHALSGRRLICALVFGCFTFLCCCCCCWFASLLRWAGDRFAAVAADVVAACAGETKEERKGKKQNLCIVNVCRAQLRWLISIEFQSCPLFPLPSYVMSFCRRLLSS